MAEREIQAIFDRPKRTALACFVGWHWWSVLSSAEGETTWQRHCLFCGRLEVYVETTNNGLRWERTVARARRASKENAHG
jgi:hypothetical protein